MPTATRPAPARLPVRPPGPRERRREVRTGVAAALGLLAVVAGVPLALALAVGNPLPDTAPSRDWLTAQVTATTVLQVLACALWLAWAHFAVCVLAEWRAARRGSGVPADVPLGGGSQQLARRLVAATLLLAGAAALVPAGAGSSGPPAPPPAVTASAVVDAHAAATAAAPDVEAAPVADVAVEAAGAKTYVVQPPDGRRYDSLWDIAERTLGDPLRYKEVFALNRDRVQPDGRTLVDADLIRPGWVLRMPADASGPGVTVPAVAPPQRQAPAAPEPAPAHEEPAAPAAAAPEAGVATTGAGVDRLLLGGGLLAAGVLVALSSRRGPYGRPAPAGAEERLRLTATPGRADLLDRALRGLAASCAAEGRPLPEVALAYVDDTRVTLSLVGLPPAPPAPWTAVADGRGWSVASGDLPAQAPDAPAPYPALACVAVLDDADVLVDLEAAPGLVSLDGDPGVAREVAASLVVELATNLWSDGVEVTAVGFGDDLSTVAPDRVRTAGALADVLAALESEARGAQEALRTLGVDGVLAGRLLRTADRRRPRVVVLSGPPTPEEAERLHRLVADVRTPLAVVCVGATPAARWRLTADGDGTLDLGVLGVRAPARRLPREAYVPLLEALREADGDRASAASTVASLTPRAAVEEVVGTGGGPAPTPATSLAPASGTSAAPALPRGLPAVEVRLLGPVRVSAPGPVDPAARDLLTEVVVSAALHRDGLHEAVLRAEVWPRGVGEDVVAATLAAAQAWLGAAPDGGPRLRPDARGRWVLTDDVHTDWDVLQAVAATADGPEEEAALRSGLARITGEAFSGTPAARFGSMAFHRAARDARVVGTAVARRAAGLASGRGDAAAAEAALRAGLALAPGAEPLWRDLLRLVAGSPGRPQEVARDAYAALAAAGLRPEAETDALVAQLAPSWAGTRVG